MYSLPVPCRGFLIWLNLVLFDPAMSLQHKCQTQATRAQYKQNDCDTSEKFDFNNDTSKTVFSFPKRFIFFFLKEFIIFDFVNFSREIHHGWKLWRAI